MSATVGGNVFSILAYTSQSTSAKMRFTVRTSTSRLSSTLSWAADKFPFAEVRKRSRTWRFEKRSGSSAFHMQERGRGTTRRIVSRLLEVTDVMARKLRSASRSPTILPARDRYVLASCCHSRRYTPLTSCHQMAYAANFNPMIQS